MVKRIVIVPDSFKGSMTSVEVADIISEAAMNVGIETIKIPIADGGEGSVDCLLEIFGGKKETAVVYGPDGNLRNASYGVTDDGIALLELAESSGLTKQAVLHPLTADTYGFGQLINDALNKGYRRLVICLGGSATTDCGLGMASALGAKFFDVADNEFVPSGGTLRNVNRIDMGSFDRRIEECDISVLCDVDVPLFGTFGAAYVFAPQKGASPTEVELLDKGLRIVAPLISEATGIGCKTVYGAGAAGGCGYACAAFLDARIASGINEILDLCNFDEVVRDCDFVVTGEGKLDSQSLMGKVLSGIQDRAEGKPIVSFCGTCQIEKEELSSQNIVAVEISKGIPLERAIQKGPEYLKMAAEWFFQNMDYLEV